MKLGACENHKATILEKMVSRWLCLVKSWCSLLGDAKFTSWPLLTHSGAWSPLPLPGIMKGWVGKRWPEREFLWRRCGLCRAERLWEDQESSRRVTAGAKHDWLRVDQSQKRSSGPKGAGLVLQLWI